MLFKSRTENNDYLILKFLNNRMQLSKSDYQNYSSLKKGYEGEFFFDALTEKLESDCLVLNDLLLKINKQTFQIDSLIIMNHEVYLLEIKNYSGDYIYKSPQLIQKEETKLTNPLIQLNRSESLLSQLLFKYNFNIPIKSFVIFPNPLFTLYQAPLGIPFIFPNQLSPFLQKLDSNTSKLQEQHKNLAKLLSSSHTIDNHFENCPPYQYHQLRKGITCSVCHSFNLSITGRSCICICCGNKESVDSAVMRNLKEFKLLLPDKKITTSGIYEWCEIIDSRKRILRILKENFNLVNKNRNSFFE